MNKPTLGIINLVLSAGLIYVIFFSFADRTEVIIGTAVLSLISVGLIISGTGFLFKKPFADTIAKLTSYFAMAIGLVVIIAGSFTLSYLTGVYGHIGRMMAMGFVILIFLSLNVFFIYPVILLKSIKNKS